MNRWVSNIVLGFFTLVLVTAYGVAKQPSPTPISPTMWLKTSSEDIDDNNDSTDELTQVQGTSLETRRIVLPDGQEITVELAITQEARMRGLSGRESLSDGTGMLFVFDEEGSQSMWMKDMNFPIDMLWLDSDGVVVHIEDGVPTPQDGQINLPTYASTTPARYVLEVAEGAAKTYGLKVGDKLSLSS